MGAEARFPLGVTFDPVLVPGVTDTQTFLYCSGQLLRENEAGPAAGKPKAALGRTPAELALIGTGVPTTHAHFQAPEA